MEYVDTFHGDKEPHRRQGRVPGLGKQPGSPQGSGGGKDQHRHRQERQSFGKLEKQSRPRRRPGQSRDPLRSRPRRRNPAQGKGSGSSGGLSGGQRRREEKADPKVHQTPSPPPFQCQLTVCHSLSLLEVLFSHCSAGKGKNPSGKVPETFPGKNEGNTRGRPGACSRRGNMKRGGFPPKRKPPLSLAKRLFTKLSAILKR